MSHQGYSVKSKRQKDSKIPTKIVVRRLPPNFSSEIFKAQVSPLPAYNYFYFVNANRVDGINSFSRVYINFINHDDMFVFKEKYDSYVFLGPKGMEYPAVVEFAPFQRIPKDRFFQKRDLKCGTILSNAYYLQFVNNLKLARCENVERPEYDLHLDVQLHQREDTTPLLKYVAAKKLEQIKSRPERKREPKLQRNENGMVFVNSSAKKNGNHHMYTKRHSH